MLARELELKENSLLEQMYFHTGFKETILFQQWAVDSEWAMIGSCIGIFLMAVLYEGLKYFR